jgi:hypothetical protein
MSAIYYSINIFKANEPNNAVSIDQLKLINLNMKIIVQKGEYRIEVCDFFGKQKIRKNFEKSLFFFRRFDLSI